jgi:uridine kinase
MPNKTTPLVIGVAGGSGSGKTTVAEMVLKQVGKQRISFLQHDSYYRELTGLPLVNFDHPDSLESEMLREHILQLKAWQAIEVPVYDFTTHSRTSQTIHVEPKRVILVEGILIFADPKLRELFDVKIFVDTDSDIRFIRRLNRDITERGRTTEMVVKQYLNTVRPMHLEFVEPSKRYADIIIPEGGLNIVAMDMVIARIESLLKEEHKEA